MSGVTYQDSEDRPKITLLTSPNPLLSVSASLREQHFRIAGHGKCLSLVRFSINSPSLIPHGITN